MAGGVFQAARDGEVALAGHEGREVQPLREQGRHGHRLLHLRALVELAGAGASSVPTTLSNTTDIMSHYRENALERQRFFLKNAIDTT